MAWQCHNHKSCGDQSFLLGAGIVAHSQHCCLMSSAKVESLRMSLALRTSLRTHYEVLGLEGQLLGLKGSKITLSLARGQHYFLNYRNLVDHLKKIFQDLFIYFILFFFGEHLHLCPWPQEGLSSKRLFLTSSLNIFCVLGLKPCVLHCSSREHH